MDADGPAELAARWIRPEIRALTAYHVPPAEGLIKLDAMENPWPWPEPLRERWQELAGRVSVNRYPDPGGAELTRRLRDTLGIADDMAVVLGNGSDELIQIIALAVAAPGRCLLSVEPGFVMYRLIASFAGLDYVGVPLRAADFGIDRAALLEAMERYEPAVVFLAYPNNPTGNLFDAADLDAVLDAAPGLVVIDEAYAPFTDSSYLGRLGRQPNLLVLRTLSKMGLAGLRLGYLVGHGAWLDEFDKVRLPYNINVLTQSAATLALEHLALFTAQTALIRAERARLFDRLAELDGVTPFPSEANFILLRVYGHDAGAVFEGLKARGVLIKDLSRAHALLDGCLRVTVGTPDENDALLDAMAAALAD